MMETPATNPETRRKFFIKEVVVVYSGWQVLASLLPGRKVLTRGRQTLRFAAMYYYLMAGVIGLIGGVSSGLFGVGGGVVMVPAMIFLMGFGANPKIAVGTSLAVIVPTAIIGAYKHHHLQQIDWRMALCLVPTAMVGGFLGAWLTTHFSNLGLKRAFGGFLLFVSLRLLFGK
jgi:uncharacterized membrane protein YfcA